jgi:hypothetical protein
VAIKPDAAAKYLVVAVSVSKGREARSYGGRHLIARIADMFASQMLNLICACPELGE